MIEITLYKEFGPAKTVKFFQIVGVHRDDTLKEIEGITEKLIAKERFPYYKKMTVSPVCVKKVNCPLRDSNPRHGLERAV